MGVWGNMEAAESLFECLEQNVATDLPRSGSARGVRHPFQAILVSDF